MASDSELVIKLQGDSEDAFDALYSKYHQAIYSNILKLTKNSEAAQDILQDVFILLWEKRMTIDNHQSVSGWLFVLSFNQSVDYIRKQTRESAARDSIIALKDVSDMGNPALLEAQYKLLESAVTQLSGQKRKAFVLCKMEGKSYDETAHAMNISKHTVKEYLSLAMASVKSFVLNPKNSLGSAVLTWFLNEWLSK